MSYSRQTRAKENSPQEPSGSKIVSPKFVDQRNSTLAQLKQQSLMKQSQMKQSLLNSKPVQREDALEEELPAQGKFTAQRAADEELETAQTKAITTQLASDQEEELPTQTKAMDASPVQRQEKANNTGLPNQLKSGIESLSGMSMDNVKVHYNSDKPAQLNAHAYAQGTDIHVAPGQEQHLPHEAWHVVQQAQGRVKPTMQMKASVPVNDDPGLEHEADVMGAKANALGSTEGAQLKKNSELNSGATSCVQASSVNTTSANYQYNNQTQSETVGRSMRATLDPGTPINGSAPGDDEQSGLMDYLKNTKDFRSMKRGHLMNGQLGGPGIATNMFPITSRANTHHQLFVENYLKQAIANNVGVMYQVDVNSEYDADTSLQGKAEFKCHSWVYDPTNQAIDLTQPAPFAEATITSLPEPGTPGDGGYQEHVNPSMRFLTRDLPPGWGERGKGLTNWNDQQPGHYTTQPGNI